MKGDFTRLTYDQQKGYTSVLQQQGRVQLDADWNEQAEISAHRDRTLALDVIGSCGAPEPGGGFALSCTEDGDLSLSPGRLYVGGTLCELGAEATYLRQPHLPRPPAISPSEGRTDLLYLDVWQRHITAIEDPDIREPALGGPDTATRVKTVWQAKVLTGVGVAGCQAPIERWPPPPSDARLAATIGGGGGRLGRPGEEELSPTGGYIPSQNQLYRVEVHEGGEMGAATFKWSRDNGSVALAVRELLPAASENNKTEAVVEPMARDGGIALKEGDWVEVLGDESELMLTPGTMACVERVDEGRQLVLLDGDASSHAGESHLKLRRWDQGGAALPVTEEIVELEEGVAVQFSGESFRTADYWMFPARETQATVDWPPRPPRGIRHDYCRLALVTWQKGGDGERSAAITDCRRLFGSLSLEPAGACGACREELAELRAMLGKQAGQLRELRSRLG